MLSWLLSQLFGNLIYYDYKSNNNNIFIHTLKLTYSSLLMVKVKKEKNILFTISKPIVWYQEVSDLIYHDYNTKRWITSFTMITKQRDE